MVFQCSRCNVGIITMPWINDRTRIIRVSICLNIQKINKKEHVVLVFSSWSKTD